MQVTRLILPSHWASILINEDITGYNGDELALIFATLKRHGVLVHDCLGSVSYGYTAYHDAECGAAECYTYAFAPTTRH